jgi:hypothetical protein
MFKKYRIYEKAANKLESIAIMFNQNICDLSTL